MATQAISGEAPFVVESVTPKGADTGKGIQTIIVGRVWFKGRWLKQSATFYLSTGEIARYKGLVGKPFREGRRG